MRPVTVLAVATAVAAFPRLIYHYEPVKTVDSNPGTEYNNTWAPSDGFTTSNETDTVQGNRTSMPTVDYDYGRCGHGFGGCEFGSCCSEHGLVLPSPSV